MKTILNVILMASLCLFGTQAFATYNSHSWKSSHNSYNKKHNSGHKSKQKNYNFKWSKNSHWNNKGGWHSAKKGNGSHHGGGSWQGNNAHAVPELDTNVAPLAGLLLTGLLAAGYERRRRKHLKTVKN